MKATHTPGPWRVGPRDDHRAEIRVFGGPGLPVAAADAAHILVTEAHANARLIAAAPDMLAVLELWENAEQCRAYIPDREKADWDRIMALTRDAIRKATGR